MEMEIAKCSLQHRQNSIKGLTKAACYSSIAIQLMEDMKWRNSLFLHQPDSPNHLIERFSRKEGLLDFFGTQLSGAET